MWGTPTATAITETEKLQTLFDTDEEVVVGELYGAFEDGTARQLAARHHDPGDQQRGCWRGGGLDATHARGRQRT